MISLVIGLTSETVKLLMDDVTEYNVAKDRLFQHKILRTDVIEEYYLNSFDEPSDKQAYRYWADRLERADKFAYFEEMDVDPMKEMSLQLMSTPHHICVCNVDDEIELVDGINVVTLKQANTHGDYNELSKFCFPLIKIIRKDEPMVEFVQWLKEILLDEARVTIIDRYICKEGKENILKDIYFPIIPQDAKIHTYFGDCDSDQATISAIKKEYGDRVTMTPSNPDDFHDRYIICNDFYISLGVGLDVFDEKTGKARKESQKIVSDGEKPKIPGPARNNTRGRRYR